MQRGILKTCLQAYEKQELGRSHYFKYAMIIRLRRHALNTTFPTKTRHDAGIACPGSPEDHSLPVFAQQHLYAPAVDFQQ